MSVTTPTTVARTSQRRQMAITSSRSAGVTMASMRSWLSEVMTSKGSMAGSRRGTAATSTSMPMPARLAVSLVAHVSPAPPRSWMPTTSPASSSARQASIRRFSSNGSPTCTLGRLASSAPLAEAGAGQHAHPADAVAPGAGPEQHGEVALAAGLAEHQPVGGQHAEAQHVHERVAAVGLVEHHLAADGRDADGVAVTGDARHDTFGDPAAAGVVERTEPQRIHERDRTSAHREDVAQDAAGAGGGALIGLDGRRDGCGSRCGWRRRSRRPRRPRRRSPPDRRAPTAPRSATATR